MKLTIKVLGANQGLFQKTEANMISAMDAMHIEGSILRVDDINSILSYGVIATPAIVINEKIKSVGEVPAISDIVDMLTGYIP